MNCYFLFYLTQSSGDQWRTVHSDPTGSNALNQAEKKENKSRQILQVQKVPEEAAGERQKAVITERRRESNNAPVSEETVAK